MTSHNWHLPDDWYHGGISPSVHLGDDVYIDSSYAFAMALSEKIPSISIGDCAGIYDRATFLVGTDGYVSIGEYTCLNGTFIICNDHISIGNHCLLSWGVVITDSPCGERTSIENRRRILRRASRNIDRQFSPLTEPIPVAIEDNVWVGFDSVIYPGVTIGSGSIIGCKTVIREDVKPFSMVVGDPARVVRQLDPGLNTDILED